MQDKNLEEVFTQEALESILPPTLSDQFFDSLYGDADEGAYDISLAYNSYDPGQQVLLFDLKLQERPGKCLACNLTYGLPEVFSRHPLINVDGMVEKIVELLGEEVNCTGWELGRTQTPAAQTHTIPLRIRLGT